MTVNTLPSQDLSPWRACVAPMLDWTDRHCRYFHRLLSPHARLYTEMLTTGALVHGNMLRFLEYNQEEHAVALQLGGSEPADLAHCAKLAQQFGYDEVNLNCGCPSERVQRGAFGACLMNEASLVADCVKAMIDAVGGDPKVPITVKHRIGIDQIESYDYVRDFVGTVADAGCEVFIVHARNAWLQGLSPKENREIPPLRYDWVHRLKRERPKLRILINGGLATVEDAVAQLGPTDGVMIGRAAYHEPYRLHLMDRAMFAPDAPPVARADLLRALRPYAEQCLSRGMALKHLTRHVLGLFHGQPGGRAFRQVLSEQAVKPGAGWEVVERAIAMTRRDEAAA